MDTILVTSATSNVGSQVVKQLATAGVNVCAAVRSIKKAEFLKGDNVKLVEMDLEQPKTIQPAFQGIDKVFLATPIASNMVDLDTLCVEAAKKAQAKLIVRLSIMGADAEIGSTLGHLHREAEKIVEASEIPYTFLRPNSFHQNYDTYVGQTIKTQNTFYLPLEDCKISVVDTRDIAAVAVAALMQSGHEGKTYEITGSEALTNEQIASILSSVLGRKITYIPVSEEATRQALQASGMSESRIELVLGLYAAQKAGHYAKISPVIEEITENKPIKFEQFVRDYVEVFQK